MICVNKNVNKKGIFFFKIFQNVNKKENYQHSILMRMSHNSGKF